MKAFDWFARISAGIGILLILFAVISIKSDTILGLSVDHGVNFFHMANSFFLITIILFLHNIKHKKE
jgi:hypothetical protein